MMPDAEFVPGETCLILDEIQDCPDARTALKSFREHGGYDVIATGSLLGVKGYGEKLKKEHNRLLGKNSVPVGYETIMTMYTLDFEEFLWANGIKEGTVEGVRRCFLNEEPVPEGVHYAFRELFLRYVAVGGLPAAVSAYLTANSMGEVARVYSSIIDEYEDDMVKYAPDEDKPRISSSIQSSGKTPDQASMKGACSGLRMPALSAAAITCTARSCRLPETGRMMFSRYMRQTSGS